METKSNLIAFQGKVVDEFGEPLEGAHVYLKDFPSFNGVPYGMITDKNGDFYLSDLSISLNSNVMITYVGKETINDLVSNLNFKTIVLKDSVTNLPGYTGTYKKKPCWLCIFAIATSFGVAVYNNKK